MLSLIFSLIAVGCSSKEKPRPEVVRPVKTMLVTAGEEDRIRSFPGVVDASRRVDLAFQVSGLLASLPVKEGQNVKEGDVIAQLRQEEFQARLASLQGQLDQARAGLAASREGERPEERLRRDSLLRGAEARLENARIEYGRRERLYQNQAGTRTAFEQAQTAYRLAQEEFEAARQMVEKGLTGREEDIQARAAEVRGLEARVVEANLQLTDSTLRAPYSGVIAQRFVEENQNVRAGEPVVRFQDIEEIEIGVDVPETIMVADLRLADILELTAQISGAPGIQFPVKIREMAQVADPTTQTFRLRVAMEAPKNLRILPGMTATVTATYRRAQVLSPRILVPVSAVHQLDSGAQVVWVVTPENVVESRPVTLGAAIGGQFEITSGLQPGERIATAGGRFLHNGMKVRDLGTALSGTQGGAQR